jgi:hypothetical protein
MDRETTKQMYAQVLQQIQAGDPMAAYSIFEQMPFPDQMAMFMTPGVGDAIAAVEAGVFNERSKENFAQGNIGRGLMDAGIGGLAMASTIPFVGKAAELGSMGVRGLRNLRSRMGDDMSGGGGGGIRTSQPEIDKLEAKKKELIKDYEVMTERMPESAARRYYPSDEIDEIDNQIYDLMSTSRGGSSLAEEGNVVIGEFFKQNNLPNIFNRRQMPGSFANTKSINMGKGLQTNVMSDEMVSAGAKVDGMLANLVDSGMEGITYNQSYTKPLRMVGNKGGVEFEIKTMPTDNGINVSVTKLEGVKPGSAADLERQRMSRLTESEQTNIPKVREMIQKEKNLVAASNKEQIANRIQRELELEGGDMAPATRKRLESKLRTLMREIAELRGN